MKNKDYLERSLSGILIALLTNLNLLSASVNKRLTAKDVFTYSIFNESTIFKEKSLVFTFLYATVIVWFLLLYGNYFRDHFGGTGIYLFLRNQNRLAWYKRYTGTLWIYSVIYTFAYTFSVFGMSLYHTGDGIDPSFFKIALYVWFILDVIVYIMALVENIVSIKYGTVAGEFAAVFILILLIQLCLRQQDYLVFQKYKALRYLNPMNGMKIYTVSLSGWKVGALAVYFLEIGIVWILGLLAVKSVDLLDKK